jgi:hypothetical protein
MYESGQLPCTFSHVVICGGHGRQRLLLTNQQRVTSYIWSCDRCDRDFGAPFARIGSGGGLGLGDGAYAVIKDA